jgi:microsomal dipeptidase-like Zn-dependent dipeptidase
MLDHLDYVANLVGWERVGIGTDWPLQAPDSVLQATFGDPAHAKQFGVAGTHRRDVTQRLIGFEDIRDLPNITRGLVKRGYGDERSGASWVRTPSRFRECLRVSPARRGTMRPDFPPVDCAQVKIAWIPVPVFTRWLV